MKPITFALTALASLAHVMANGWNNVTESSSSPEYTTSFLPSSTETTLLPEFTTSYFPSYNETVLLPDNRTDYLPSYSLLPDDRTDTIPPITTFTTHTGYTTYCPESTVLTITVCVENGECAPQVYTVPESSTLTITDDCIFPTTYEEKEAPETVTGFTTYLPGPTVVTIETCSGTECAPHEYTVSEPTTLTVNEAVIPTTVRPADSEPTTLTVNEAVNPTTVRPADSEPTTLTVNEAVNPTTVRSAVSSAAASSTLAAVWTYEGGAAKVATGFAGFAGLVGIAVLV